MKDVFQVRPSSQNMARQAVRIMTVVVLIVLSAVAANAQHYKVLYKFQNTPDAANPFAGLVRDAEGNLYGTSFEGGIGDGTIFKVDRTGKETVLHSFNDSDGDLPTSTLVRDAKGNLYGTADEGGAAGYGTVFKVDASGKFSLLYSFTGGTDGAFPFAGLVQDADGNLYGTTHSGGTSNCDIGAGNCGVVFKVDTTGKETVMYSFTGPDGAQPRASLAMDGSGNLYGTTSNGGAGRGVVFKLDPSGTETVLHNFAGADGDEPYAGLIMDTAGNLYGTTLFGGAVGWGTVFKIDTTGKETVLYSFTGGADGKQPQAGVIMDKAGNLYGTTSRGGPNKPHGVIFKLDPAGKETVLYAFPNRSGGIQPLGGLVTDAKGNLYGTASLGGGPPCSSCGVVFRLAP